ncbi:DUF423 domain-containing protein [Gorillibacterium sp. sgz5001074]|uniref:DUF423 domain-containing protein n=1 Tax=Gorillibacterium sp. sgz5001074 TaxID=3446695 RepID=UPI003F6656D7
MKRILAWGAVFGFLSVAIGAFGAHILKERLDEDAMAVFQTGVQYHMAHALAMVLAALLADRLAGKASERLAVRAGWCFAAGILLFSGSLYALAVSGVKVLGAITPLGGVSFLAGWAMLAAAGWRR